MLISHSTSKRLTCSVCIYIYNCRMHLIRKMFERLHTSSFLNQSPNDVFSGTQIYSLNGTDPEGQEVRYGLSFDPGSKEYFRVDPKSGNITLVDKLDREVNPSDVNVDEESVLGKLCIYTMLCH